MAAGWILHTLFTALVAQQAVHPNDQPWSRAGTNATTIRPIVHTASGDLRGVQKKSISGVLVDSFLGIPYAMPPIGKRRFAAPVTSSAWSGVRDASEFGNECVQFLVSENAFQVSEKPLAKTEDCLYLNIYKPITKTRALLPVMFWIHGGAFILGAGSEYDGTDLASKGVIVVTINYRLDIFGFLSNSDDVIPGNFGMLDQVRALEWVHRNIQSFGGDPNQVTIFGQSAGSASVSLLILSPLTKGLFSRAIMESGTSLSPWAIVQPTNGVTSKQVVNLIGTFVGCTDDDATKKLECLRNADAGALRNASIDVRHALGAIIHVPPVVENTFGFLPDLPERLLTQNKFNHVDTIHGFNKGEYGYNYRTNYSLTKQDFISGVKETLKAYAILDRDAFVDELFQDYIGNSTDGHNMLLQTDYVISDINFKGPALIEANIESALAPEKKHYVYEFDYRSALSGFPMWLPAIHGTELKYVFGVNLKPFQKPGITPSAQDQAISDQIQTLWTNFAKYGNPTSTIPSGAVRWNEYKSQNEMVLRIKAKTDEVSFLKHLSQSVTKKLNSIMSSSILDKYVVG